MTGFISNLNLNRSSVNSSGRKSFTGNSCYLELSEETSCFISAFCRFSRGTSKRGSSKALPCQNYSFRARKYLQALDASEAHINIDYATLSQWHDKYALPLLINSIFL